MLVGYAGISRLGRMRPYEYEIHTIGVDPDLPGPEDRASAGLGGDLLDFASGGTVFLEVRTDNEAAIALYESVGFVNIGLRKRYYRASGADHLHLPNAFPKEPDVIILAIESSPERNRSRYRRPRDR